MDSPQLPVMTPEREEITADGPPWGRVFPYRCGVTEADFLFWATVATDYDGRVRDVGVFADIVYVDQVLARFCHLCDPPFRRAAVARGTCIATP